MSRARLRACAPPKVDETGLLRRSASLRAEPVPSKSAIRLTCPRQPQRLIIAPAGTGCKRWLGGGLLESQRFTVSQESNRFLQTPGPCLLPLGGFDPADIPSPM